MAASSPLVGNWNYPTAIRFGAGRIRELPEACEAVGLKRPLLVTDPGLAKLPMIADAVMALRKAGLEVSVFSEVKPNPIAANVEAGIRVLRAGKHDGVIAWGGGSGIDAAKAIAFMAGQTRPMWDFEDVGDWWTRADPKGIAPVKVPSPQSFPYRAKVTREIIPSASWFKQTPPLPTISYLKSAFLVSFSFCIFIGLSHRAIQPDSTLSWTRESDVSALGTTYWASAS